MIAGLLLPRPQLRQDVTARRKLAQTRAAVATQLKTQETAQQQHFPLFPSSPLFVFFFHDYRESCRRRRFYFFTAAATTFVEKVSPDLGALIP